MRDPIKNLLAEVKTVEQERLAKAMDGVDTHPGRLTHGPEVNNLAGPYSQGTGVWSLFLIERLSSDVVHLHLSHMALMYRKVRESNQTNPTPRGVKDILLRDRYFVHQN
jgi:hypothetical protein